MSITAYQHECCAWAFEEFRPNGRACRCGCHKWTADAYNLGARDQLAALEPVLAALAQAKEQLEASGHADPLCGTTTKMANGRFFHEGCSCGLDTAIDDANAALRDAGLRGDTNGEG